MNRTMYDTLVYTSVIYMYIYICICMSLYVEDVRLVDSSRSRGHLNSRLHHQCCQSFLQLVYFVRLTN